MKLVVKAVPSSRRCRGPGRCALEYLLSRPEVDRRRVGMTGASGGGYNTWITAALDDRISVAVPVVGTSEFYEQIHVTRALCCRRRSG